MKLDLMILDGSQAGRRVGVADQPVVFGRSPEAQVAFPTDGFMSSRHLSAHAVASGIRVVDLGSTNGTTLNGAPITEATAGPGDVVKFGSVSMQAIPALPVVGRPDPAAQTLQVPVVRSFSDSGKTSIVKPSMWAKSPKKEGPPEASPIDPVVEDLAPAAALLRRLGAGKLYCLLDTAVDPVIPSMLDLASERKECLYEGESAVKLARVAPYLVELPPQGRLLNVLAVQGWGKSWASYFVSDAPFEELRGHFRRFLMVQLEGGKEVYFRFYDPRVLREFLPTTSGPELRTFMGPVGAWLIEADPAASLLELRAGDQGLQTVTHPVGGA